jgi:NTE family protein
VFDGDNVVARRQSSLAEASLQLGYTLARYGFVGVGRTEGRLKVETTIAPAPQPAVYADTDRWTALLLVDRLDSYAFPRRGYLLGGEFHRFDRNAGEDNASRLAAVNLLAAWTSGRYTLLLDAFSVRARGNGVGYQLGGFLNLSGTPRGRLAGEKTLFVGLIGYREITDLLGETPAPTYIGASLETGNSDSTSGALDWDRLKRAGAAFLAADTLAGPIYFGYGHTAGGRSALYLFWGLFWGRF